MRNTNIKILNRSEQKEVNTLNMDADINSHYILQNFCDINILVQLVVMRKRVDYIVLLPFLLEYFV